MHVYLLNCLLMWNTGKTDSGGEDNKLPVNVVDVTVTIQ